MEWFLFWLMFSVVVGVIASSRGRTGFGWFLLSMIISPLLGILLVALLPRVTVPGDPDARPTPETHVRCPDCAEFVLKEARKCKHCGAQLVPVSEQPKLSEPAPPIVVTPPSTEEIERAVSARGRRWD